MAHKIISIVTGCGRDLGSGHLQRMLSLLWHLNGKKNMSAFITGKNIRDYVPDELKSFIKREIDPLSDLIIRDMRDSSQDEILKLKSISRVMVIDDLGEGRISADHRINLLPNLVDPIENNPGMELFIYGYTFIRSIGTISSPIIEKDIDVLYYPGFHQAREYLEKIISCIPGRASYAVLTNNDSYVIIKESNGIKTDRSYSHMLLSGRVVITHFGITLFEAALSGCNIIAVHPTKYHFDLAEKTKSLLDIENCGVYENLDYHHAADAVKRGIDGSRKEIITPREIYSKILKNLNNFSSLIENLC